MKHTDFQKLCEAGSITDTRRGGNRHGRIEHLTAQRGHSIHNNNNPEEI
jgi:hypothetical protein